jgi:hypothetical protein
LGRRDAPRSQAKSRKKLPMLAVCAALGAAALIAGAVWFHHRMQSSMYALRAIASSVDEHDWEKFSTFVDLESLYETTVKNVKGDPDSVAVDDIAYLMLSKTREYFIDQLKEQIRQPREGKKSFWGHLFNQESIRQVKQTVLDNGRMVRMEIPCVTEYLNLEAPIVITFRKDFLHLTLVDIDLSRYEQANKKIEELLSVHYNLPIRDSLNSLARLSTVCKYKDCIGWIGIDCMEIDLIINTRVENLANEEIAKIDFEIYPGTKWLNSPINKQQSMENIAAGQHVYTGTYRGWAYNPADEADSLFLGAANSEICYKVTKIEFKSGRVIKENQYKYLREYQQGGPDLEDILSRRELYGFNDGPQIRELLGGGNFEFALNTLPPRGRMKAWLKTKVIDRLSMNP